MLVSQAVRRACSSPTYELLTADFFPFSDGGGAVAEAAPVRKSAICFHNLEGYGDNARPLTTKMIALESFLLLPLVPLNTPSP